MIKSLFASFAAFKERIAGPPSRRASYYALSQTAYTCLAGSFEMPMALRLAGRIDFVALVYGFFYCTLLAGFALGLVLVREGRASFVFRLQQGLLVLLCLGSAALFPLMTGLVALIPYFLVRGLAEGFYWAARHRSMLWAVRDANRDRFALRLQTMVVAVSVLLPLVGGLAITGFDLPGLAHSGIGAAAAASAPPAGRLPAGYIAIFLITGTAILAALAFSPDFRIGRSPLSFRTAISVRRLREAASWRVYIGMTAFSGVFVGVGTGVLNFGILKTEFRIGAFNASVALLSGLSFYLLSRFAAGREGVRVRAVFVGMLSELVSRFSYAFFPGPGVLVAKGILDSAAVPLKSLFGENVNFAVVERMAARSGASIAEIYLYREIRIWTFRMMACAAAGIAVALASPAIAAGAAGAAAGSELVANGRAVGRFLLALAAPAPIAEAFLIRSFVRGIASDKARAAAAAKAAAAAAAAAKPDAAPDRGGRAD